MEKKVMSKAELLERREELIEEHKSVQPKSAKAPRLCKKEKKVLGIGKDQGVASVKNVRVTPQKVGTVVPMIRNKNLDEALAILMYTPKAACPELVKLLNSAAANAVNNNSLNREQLYVASVEVGPGITMKRWRARGRGGAAPVMKRTSNIKVVLKERA